MKDFSIFVEGDADKRFVEDYLFFLSTQNQRIALPEGWKNNIYPTGGWTNLGASKGESHRNLMSRTTRKGGVNLVIFDSDEDLKNRLIELEQVKVNFGLIFKTFLFPNNHDHGTLENLLEKIVNSQNQCVIDCWKRYEEDLSHQQIQWKNPPVPTSPSLKSMIYAYLEAIVGSSNSEKEKIKDKNRDFLNNFHWNLSVSYLDSLKEFFWENLL